jgi:hypothetical protein
MSVQRWDVNYYDSMADVAIEESDSGDYVEYDDYAYLAVQLRDAKRELTAYQIAKDNLELRLDWPHDVPEPPRVY